MKSGQRRFPDMLRALCFCVTAIAMLLVLSLVMTPNKMETRARKSFYAEKANSLDMVFIGGSISMYGWAPYIAWQSQGLASYSYGLPRMDSFYVIPMVKEVLTYQSPKLLVFDLRPFQYAGINERKKETGLDLIGSMPLYSPNRITVAIDDHMYAENQYPPDTIETYLFDLTRYHDRWRDVNSDSFRWAFVGHSIYNTKGFYGELGIMDINLEDQSAITDTLPVAANGEKDLRDLMAYLKSRGQQAIFTVISYHESADQRRQYNYLAKIILAEGFGYLNANDYNSQMGMDHSRDYYDNNHLSIFGAQKYTRFFAEYLATHYQLPDRREDPAYESWRQGYESWKVIEAQIEQRTQTAPSKNKPEAPK